MSVDSQTIKDAPEGQVHTDVDNVMEVRNLAMRFLVGGAFDKREVHALEDVSFDIPRGKVVALVGESGSGKSTTARALARLITPTSGKIIYNGQDILETEPKKPSLKYRNEVQMVFQDPFGSLNPAHSIKYTLGRVLKIHGKTDEPQKRIEELLETVGLSPGREFKEKFPYELSGGQRQRVAFARALAVEPKVLLADEPVSMLDVSIRVGVLNLMDRLRSEQGLSLLYITHDIASARYLGDSINVMYAGRMVESAESSELVDEPAHPYTRLLLSAVPNPHAGLKTDEKRARGEIPSLIDPPPGCPFAQRCPHAMPICRETMPGITKLSDKHWVRCHLHGSEESSRANK